MRPQFSFFILGRSCRERRTPLRKFVSIIFSQSSSPISSESAVNIPAEMIHYGVTKTMQVALARGLAETTAGSSVTVNSVLAGPTRSEGVEQFIEDMATQQGKSPDIVEKEFFESVRPSSLIKRFVSIEEVASMVVFLASPLAAATNGAAVRVEGALVRSIL